MTGKNKILIGCLALLLALSVGYALFSDTITINGTATAKGDFQITTEVVDINNDPVSSSIPEGQSCGIVENPTISLVDNVVTTNVTLGAPDSFHKFIIKMTNTGSIPAKLNSIVDKTNNITISKANLEENACYNLARYENGDFNAWLNIDDGWTYDYDNEDLPIEYRVFNVGNLCYETFDAVLEPGEYTYYYVEYIWNIQATEQTEPQTFNWDLEINWQQVTTE